MPLQLKRVAAATLAAATPADGEPVWTTDTGELYVGDGATVGGVLVGPAAAPAGVVLESDYNANTILAATTDDTPVALTVAEQTLVGRITGGAIDDLSASTVRTLINVADGANAYVHPNHSGDVTSVADGAQAIAAGAVTLAKMADLAQDSIISRVSAGAGVPEAVTVAEATLVGRITGGHVDDLAASAVRTLINVEDGADVTSTHETSHATVVVDADFASNGILERTSAGVYGIVAKPTGALVGLSDTQALTAKDLTAETNTLHFSKGVSIENPTSGDVVTIYMNERAVKVKGASFASAAGTSVAFEVQHNTAIASGGTTIHADTCATSTPEWDVTPSGGANFAVATDKVINVVIGTVTGSVTMFHVTVEFDEA